MIKAISMDEFTQKEKREPLEILDVREVDEFAQGHIKTAQNLPLSELTEQISDLEKDKNYYVICHSGARSQTSIGVDKQSLMKSKKVQKNMLLF